MPKNSNPIKQNLDQTTEEIRYAKDRQWHTVYLTVLLFGAIIAYFRADLKMPMETLRIAKIVAYHLILIITAASLLIQCNTAFSLQEYRRGLPNWERYEKEKRIQTSIYTGFFIFLAIVGALAAFLAVRFT